MSDARSDWLEMTPEQRLEFLEWMAEEAPPTELYKVAVEEGWRRMSREQRVRFLNFLWQEIQNRPDSAYSSYKTGDRVTRWIEFGSS